MQGTFMDTADIVTNKTLKIPAFMKLMFQVGM